MVEITIQLTELQVRDTRRGLKVHVLTPDQIATIGGKISVSKRKNHRGGRPQTCFCDQCSNCRRRIKQKEKRESDRLAALRGRNQAEWVLPAGQQMPECKPVASINQIRKF